MRLASVMLSTRRSSAAIGNAMSERFRAGTRAQAVLRSRGLSLIPFDRRAISARACIDRRTIAVPDIEAARDEFPSTVDAARIIGFVAQVSAPLLRGDDAVGVISLYSYETHVFTQRQVKLLETFADQAVIAIENARLFEELQEANGQLAEARSTSRSSWRT